MARLNTYPKDDIRSRLMEPAKMNPWLIRTEDVIRDDLRGQLEEMFARWEQWKCQA